METLTYSFDSRNYKNLCKSFGIYFVHFSKNLPDFQISRTYFFFKKEAYNEKQTVADKKPIRIKAFWLLDKKITHRPLKEKEITLKRSRGDALGTFLKEF